MTDEDSISSEDSDISDNEFRSIVQLLSRDMIPNHLETVSEYEETYQQDKDSINIKLYYETNIIDELHYTYNLPIVKNHTKNNNHNKFIFYDDKNDFINNGICLWDKIDFCYIYLYNTTFYRLVNSTETYRKRLPIPGDIISLFFYDKNKNVFRDGGYCTLTINDIKKGSLIIQDFITSKTLLE